LAEATTTSANAWTSLAHAQSPKQSSMDGMSMVGDTLGEQQSGCDLMDTTAETTSPSGYPGATTPCDAWSRQSPRTGALETPVLSHQTIGDQWANKERAPVDTQRACNGNDAWAHMSHTKRQKPPTPTHNQHSVTLNPAIEPFHPKHHHRHHQQQLAKQSQNDAVDVDMTDDDEDDDLIVITSSSDSALLFTTTERACGPGRSQYRPTNRRRRRPSSIIVCESLPRRFVSRAS
jgi:hypothetical protein